ncbi:MAG TPA: GNAT family N-acetyltransferase, partial [Candidatus Acidoferrales bacterium]|nr:GNAT family N-acetyltransferase [Candidatus Acidoferrales bacterium]
MSPTERTHADWTLQPYRPGDEHGILAMFNEEFGRQRSLAHWTWKFGRNPYGGPFITLARRRSDDAIVGNHVLMPVKLNVLGRPVLAGHSLDLVVRRPYWGQGIFESAGRDCIERFRQAGGAAVFAFPNASSYPGFVRSLGWERIAYPVLRRRPLDLGRALEQRGVPRLAARLAGAPSRFAARWRLARERRTGGRLRLSTGSEVPEGYDALWDACRSQEVVSLWKDREYLDWRYVANPDTTFLFHAVADGSVMLGLAVTAERDGVCWLCELIVRERDAEVGRALLWQVERAALDRRARAIQFLGHDAGFFGEVLADYARR